MTETVSQFQQRVAQLRDECPKWRHGQTVFNAMAFMHLGASDEQAAFAEQHRGKPLGPYHDDSRISAFLAAAVADGVLRADE